jgi:hypothetical protein
MMERSKRYTDKPDFNTLIPGYSDSEIINILKKRNLYQPEAAELAIKEAIKREIIYSEHDLLSEEYRVKPLKNSIFPNIENENQRKKISKSITRGLIISGAIPLIYGIMQFFDGNLTEGFIISSGSIIWLIFSVLLFRVVKRPIINSLFVIALISVFYLANLFIQRSSLKMMDFFIPIFFYFLVFYGLLFLKKINQ